jgi:hypothetical protein
MGLIERARNEETKKQRLEELQMPDFPTPVQYLWNTFRRLSHRRTSGAYGPNPITWQDIDAFCRVTRMSLVPWEIEVIEMLDDMWRSERVKALG